MNKLYPNAVARRVWQITPQLLNSWGVKGLILDIDNTLTTHNNPIPEPQVAQWLEDNRRAGIRMIVLSNNHPERVRPFAQALGLEFIADGAKPLKKGYQRCSQALGLPCEQLCMVGDQIFTVELGGRIPFYERSGRWTMSSCVTSCCSRTRCSSSTCWATWKRC